MGIIETFIGTVLPFLIVLTALIFFHELGHYWVARRFGVRVETFAIGFGKELFGWTDRHGTRWKICLLPLGGYVKMFGAHETPEFHAKQTLTAAERKVAFDFKPLWQRALVVAAGPAANFLLAIILFAFVIGFEGEKVSAPVLGSGGENSFVQSAGLQPKDKIIAVDDSKILSFDDLTTQLKKHEGEAVSLTYLRQDAEYTTTIDVPQKDKLPDNYYNFLPFLTTTIAGVQKGDPASQAGLQVGDVILTVNGQKIDDFETLREELKQKPTEPLKLTVQREAEVKDITIQPKSVEKDGKTIGYIGVIPQPILNTVSHNPLTAIIHATEQTWAWTYQIIQNIGSLISGQQSVNQMSGVIGIAQFVGEFTKQGIFAVLSFMAIISVNLGLLNLLPIPVLDGGHLAFYAAESVMRKPLSEKTKNALMIVGLMFIVGLFLLTTVVDIRRLL